jgi:hypothetical protein
VVASGVFPLKKCSLSANTALSNACGEINLVQWSAAVRKTGLFILPIVIIHNFIAK